MGVSGHVTPFITPIPDNELVVHTHRQEPFHAPQSL
jgi:hypothetical protein